MLLNYVSEEARHMPDNQKPTDKRPKKLLHFNCIWSDFAYGKKGWEWEKDPIIVWNVETSL